MRMHASWFGSQRPTGYKVAARTPRAATASSPRTRHPDHTERAAVLGSIKARPGNDGACGQRRAMADLDSPCARRPPTHVGRGEETGFQVEQRNWYQGSGECREMVLDIRSFNPKLEAAAARLGPLRTPEGEPIPPNTLAALKRDLERHRIVDPDNIEGWIGLGDSRHRCRNGGLNRRTQGSAKSHQTTYS